MSRAPAGAGTPRPAAGPRSVPQRGEPGPPPAGGGAPPAFHVVVLVAGVGFGLTAPYTALLVVALGASPAAAAVVVASMGLSLLIVDFFGTRWVPRLDSRVALTASMLVFGVGSVLTCLTTTWEVVGLARVLQGFGTALFMTGGVQLAVRLARTDGDGAAIGTFNAAWFAGIALGPVGGGLIAGLLPGADGLRLLFGCCAVLNVIGAAAAWWLTPRMRSEQRPRLGLPRRLGLHGPRAWAVLTLAGTGQAVRSGLAMTLVPLLGERLGAPWLLLGATLACLALTDIVTMHWGARWADRRGRRGLLAWSLLWGAGATLALAHLAGTVPLFALGALALGFTVGATWVLPTAMAVDIAPDPERGLAAYRIASDVGMLGGGLLTALALTLGDVRSAMTAAAVLLLAALVLTLAVGETRRHPSSTGGTHAPAVP